MIFSRTKPNIGGYTLGFIRFSKVFVGLSAAHYCVNLVMFGMPFSPKLAEIVGEVVPGTLGLIAFLVVLFGGMLLSLLGPFLLLQLVWAYWDESRKKGPVDNH